MKISAQDYEHICVLTVSGDYTSEDVDSFRRVVDDHIAGGARHILLDCEHLEFIDSEALESLLRLRETLAPRNGQICLINPDENVAKILEITRLDRAFPAHSTVETAVRSVR